MKTTTKYSKGGKAVGVKKKSATMHIPATPAGSNKARIAAIGTPKKSGTKAAVVMKKGGTKKPLKKAQDGGSNLKEFRKRSFDYEGYDPEFKDRTTKQFAADKKGKLSTTTTSYKSGVTVGGLEVPYFPSRRTTLDTTGYSSGRQEFPAKVGVNDGHMQIGYANPYSETTVYVPRKDVPKVIANMKKGTGPDLVKKNTANKAKVAANKAKVEANAKKVAANAAKYKKSKVGGPVKSKKK